MCKLRFRYHYADSDAYVMLPCLSLPPLTAAQRMRVGGMEDLQDRLLQVVDKYRETFFATSASAQALECQRQWRMRSRWWVRRRWWSWLRPHCRSR